MKGPKENGGESMGRILGFFRLFRRDLILMFIAMRDPRTPKTVKGLLALAALYLISPVDLIPDTIPLLGMMDDVVIIPAAVCGLMNLLPPAVRRESEEKAARAARRMPYILLAASFMIFLWVMFIIWAIYALIFK